MRALQIDWAAPADSMWLQLVAAHRKVNCSLTMKIIVKCAFFFYFDIILYTCCREELQGVKKRELCGTVFSQI